MVRVNVELDLPRGVELLERTGTQLYCTRPRTTLARSASEGQSKGRNPVPRLRFGLVSLCRPD